MERRRLLRAALAMALAAGATGTAAAGPPRPGRKPAPPRPRLIMLDPGHGGHDPGALGDGGVMEKDVVLDIARIMAELIDVAGAGRVRVALTRTRDEFLPLPRRVEIARAAQADLFLSIHADSAPNAQARGISAYTLSNKATDAFAAGLAKRENLAGGLNLGAADNDVAGILADLTLRHTANAALVARQRLVAGAGKRLTLLDNPMRAARFAVLRAPDVPSVLIETGFLSNAEDGKLLASAAGRQRVAGVLAQEVVAVMGMAPFA